MKLPEIILEDKSKQDVFNLIRQINKNLYLNIEVIYVLSNRRNKEEYSNNSLILNEGSNRNTIFHLIAESLLEIDEITEDLREEFFSKKQLASGRGNLNGIVLNEIDLNTFQGFFSNCLLYYLDNPKGFAVIYPKSYSVIKRLFTKGIKNENRNT